MKYFEYRGVSGAVYAEVLQDDTNGYVTGPVKEFVGLAEVGKTTESSNATHYYDNIPAIIISSTGSDELSLNTAGIDLDVVADITGQFYDPATGMFVEQERTPKYFAVGYRTQKTDGTEVLVWRLKGSFTVPQQTSQTMDDGTDANGQTLTFTGISTAHKFNATGKPAKAINIDTSVNTSVDVEQFFQTVQTPDTMSGGAIAVTGVIAAPTSLALNVGDEQTVTATVMPSSATNKNVTWSSSDDMIASVDQTGKVTAVATGTATITVTTQDGGFSAICDVTVA